MYEFDGNNELTARHTHGPGVDDPLYTTTPVGSGPIGEISPDPATTENYYYHKDGINSVREITNEDGEVVHRTDFNTFGNILAVNDCPYSSTLSSSNASIGDPAYHHDFFFTYSYTGRQWDAEIDMYYYRARYYDAEIGHFISEDPQWAQNLYAYVSHNPINYVDPSGKFLQFALWVTFVYVPVGIWAGFNFIPQPVFNNLSINEISDLYKGIKYVYEKGLSVIRSAFFNDSELFLKTYMRLGRLGMSRYGRWLIDNALDNEWDGTFIIDTRDPDTGKINYGYSSNREHIGLYSEHPLNDSYELDDTIVHELFHYGLDEEWFSSSDNFHSAIKNNSEWDKLVIDFYQPTEIIK